MDQYHLATRGDSEGLWDWNLASNRIHFSPRWISMVGCEEHEVGNTPEEWLQRVHPEDLSQVQREIHAHLAEGPCEFDLRHRMLHKDGTYRWMSCRGVVVRNEGGQAVRVMGSHSDVTADKVADALTGLPNRLLFLDHLTRSIERAKRHQAFHFAVLLLDLDRPETLTEQLGPTAGDPLLTAAARRLETCLRAGDTPASLSRDHLVARLRGDEFAILLDGLKEVGDARVVADRVLAEILVPYTLGGREVFLRASIGIALSATGYTQAEDVLRDAATALHRAKLLGRARCEIFDTAIVKSVQAELELEADFKGALERREFLLFYQPIVSLASNQIVGFEALARWQHPVRGMILPLEFIPIAEKTGFIVPLGTWILREACLQLRAWKESLPISKDLWISVNLSSPQFRHPTLVEQIGEALRDVGLEAHCLMLELTEGVAMENPTAVKGLLMQLRVMGARVGLDDFGTGHSSLAYLHQFPADFLKLDRAFVRDMETRQDMRDIVGTVTALAQQLGLHVVAEGIENEEQLALVRSLQCEYAQGFLFSRPVDNERAADLLKTGLPPRLGSRCEGGPAPDLRPEGRLPEQQEGRRLPRKPRSLYIVAAALTVLISAGVVARFTHGLPPPARSSSQPALENAGQGPRVGTPAGPGTQQRMPDAVAVNSTPTAPKASGVGRKKGVPPESAAKHPARVTSGNTATGESGRTGASASDPAPPAAKPLTYSLAVVHRHVLGSCRGLLIVSRDGVVFVPDKEKGEVKDAFTLKYNEFLYVLSDDRLTIKSNAKTYRFKAADVTGKDDNRSRLQKVVESITRLRHATPTS
jgi:diguanylate cyclase (GGDEF)-like protein/PAS domain S-box-containing protein